VRFSIPVNGTPSSVFNSTRGLRQRDPLSPLLFVVVMEDLSRMLITAVDQGHFIGFLVGPRDSDALIMNHLLFTNDTLIFCSAQEEQIQHLRCIFLYFEAASGLRINLGKSKIVPTGEIEDVKGLAQLLGCQVASLPMTYLSLSLGASYKAVSIWNGVIEKIERRLAGWKRMYLSKGGRVTLPKSTISNLPKYYLSVFPILVGIGDEDKFYLVNWNKICTPLHSSG
jgi:hypothetical protein